MWAGKYYTNNICIIFAFDSDFVGNSCNKFKTIFKNLALGKLKSKRFWTCKEIQDYKKMKSRFFNYVKQVLITSLGKSSTQNAHSMHADRKT